MADGMKQTQPAGTWQLVSISMRDLNHSGRVAVGVGVRYTDARSLTSVDWHWED
jgi:hypothetical protein